MLGDAVAQPRSGRREGRGGPPETRAGEQGVLALGPLEASRSPRPPPTPPVALLAPSLPGAA